MNIDIFNGDADGICSLLQLRLAEPAEAALITGVKRDIQLVRKARVQPGDEVTVLDVALSKNAAGLERILSEGAKVLYIDHHQPGEIPVHPALTTLIDTDANVCTGLLTDAYLRGRYRAWAVTAAFGDNLADSARAAAASLALSEAELSQLQKLGTYLNYNAYGDTVDDLHFAPDRLFREMAGFASPFDFMAEKKAIFERLADGYEDDLNRARECRPEYSGAEAEVYILPDAPWSRRVSGVFGNELANRSPKRAHAILSYNADNSFQVSVRAPLLDKRGADELCLLFPTGGGRKAAAGINSLPRTRLREFIAEFSRRYRSHH